MTTTQKEVIKFLKNLVHKRYNIDTLNNELSQYFKEDIKAEFASENDYLTDYNIMFESKNKETYGDFDIYVLLMRQPGFDNSTFMITEIGYEF